MNMPSIQSSLERLTVSAGRAVLAGYALAVMFQGLVVAVV